MEKREHDSQKVNNITINHWRETGRESILFIKCLLAEDGESFSMAAGHRGSLRLYNCILVQVAAEMSSQDP